MAINVEKIAAALKDIIDQNGMAYLTDEPYKVYTELIQNGNTDRKTASMILYLLVNDIHRKIDTESSLLVVSKVIQDRCSLNKKAADYLADILLSLYSKENEKAWKEKEMKGLSSFLGKDTAFTWKGFSVWDEGNGTVDCRYEAEIVLVLTEEIVKDKKLDSLLKKNPFMTKEAIDDYFEKKLSNYLDEEFEKYCLCDDYYQPVVEDFEIDYYVSEWARENGFEMVSCEGRGEDGGYEPKLRKGWY